MCIDGMSYTVSLELLPSIASMSFRNGLLDFTVIPKLLLLSVDEFANDWFQIKEWHFHSSCIDSHDLYPLLHFRGC